MQYPQDTVIVAGSIPKSVPADAYEQIAKITSETGAKLVVDAEKDLVESVLKYNPLFIKPNKDELEVMFNTEITTRFTSNLGNLFISIRWYTFRNATRNDNCVLGSC